MKRVIGFMSLALALVVMASCGGDKNKVEVGHRTTLKVNAVFDAGKVAIGEVIHAKFTVENTGDSPLVFSDVKGTCSCTIADYPKEAIAPGEKGIIRATVDTKSAPVGRLQKSIRILANTTPELTVVSVQANIIN